MFSGVTSDLPTNTSGENVKSKGALIHSLTQGNF